MRKLLLIGIGAGDPEQLTVQAINAMNTVDAFFVLDKGGKITYCEYVPEVAQHPNYEKAMEALKAAAG